MLQVKRTVLSSRPETDTVTGIAGIFVLAVNDRIGSDSPTTPSYFIRTWNRYPVVGVRPVATTLLSSCNAVPESVESPTSTQLDKAVPTAPMRYCHLNAVNILSRPLAGSAQFSVREPVVAAELVGSATAGIAVAVPDPLVGSEMPLLPVLLERTWK